ncbi:MAG: hypothetical protein AXA67_02245 [Methylothermaceae bacteria B42]|nr:MAG: hypothetical protein AXA67_02245 [Methylothermaceae bacteria B42]HHJ39307.1 pilus assembly protein PilX [Methylothermaceae bacterium]
MMEKRFSASRAQSGAALVVSLLMLTVLTMLGVSAMQSTILQEKMAGNYRNRNLAFNAAETALRDAERYIAANISADSPFTTTCASGLCLPSSTGTPVWENIDWSDAGNVLTYGVGGGGTIAGISSNPTMIIEILDELPQSNSLEAGVVFESNLYRITARGVGGTDSAVVILQETLKN